jgi:ATP-dependent Zn protease
MNEEVLEICKQPNKLAEVGFSIPSGLLYRRMVLIMI